VCFGQSQGATMGYRLPMGYSHLITANRSNMLASMLPVDAVAPADKMRPLDSGLDVPIDPSTPRLLNQPPPATLPTKHREAKQTAAPRYTTRGTGITFYLNTTPSSWADAELGCQSSGGHLAAYSTFAEQKVRQRQCGKAQLTGLCYKHGACHRILPSDM
jgi:hypothetical protein